MRKIINKILKRNIQITSSYHRTFAEKTLSYIDIKNKKCLIIGCKRGLDCSYFVEFGAQEVHGLDICEDIGADFPHERIKYHKISAEDMFEINDLTFDLVYALATMEHIPDIKKAYNEMVRVAKSGGIIYTFSAPLWNSREGHHKSVFFKNYPWIHLRLTESQICEYCVTNSIIDKEKRIDMKDHIHYMLNPKFFNMLPAKKYIETCNNLKNINIIENKLGRDNEKYLTSKILAELKLKGLSEEELLATSHTFVASKKII